MLHVFYFYSDNYAHDCKLRYSKYYSFKSINFSKSNLNKLNLIYNFLSSKEIYLSDINYKYLNLTLYLTNPFLYNIFNRNNIFASYLIKVNQSNINFYTCSDKKIIKIKILRRDIDNYSNEMHAVDPYIDFSIIINLNNNTILNVLNYNKIVRLNNVKFYINEIIPNTINLLNHDLSNILNKILFKYFLE